MPNPGRSSHCCACFAAVVLAACGGESTSRGTPTSTPATPATASANAPAPVPTATNEETPPPAVPTRSCPASYVELELDAWNGSITDGPDGITVEALQIPDYPAPDYTKPPPPPSSSDPASWDRSELPAGACVFRVHGLQAACFPTGGEMLVATGPPSPKPQVIELTSFYYYEGCGVAPGCPSADARASLGWWWYLADRGDAMDIVICAPECATELVPYRSATVEFDPARVCSR